MTKRILLFLSIIIALALASIPALAGISGTGATGVQVQNLSASNSADVSVQLWNQTGAAPIDLGTTSIDPLTATNYYMPSYGSVPSGAYAMIASADQPIAAIVRTDWSASGGAALYNSIEPDTDIIIPLVLHNFNGQSSQFTIQNTNPSSAISDVDITLYGRGLSSPVATLNNESIPAGTSVTYTLSDPAWGTLPDTGLDLGASGFVGAVQITSATGLVAQSFIDVSGSRGVTGFSAVPSASASTTLYCPLIRANFYGDTGISIVNMNSSGVDVTIEFKSDTGSPNSGTFTQNLSIGANSSEIAFQGPGGNSRSAPTNLPGGSQTGADPTPTNDGFYGVAKITATGDVLAVVNDTLFGSGWSTESQSSYNCFNTSDAGLTFALPLVRRYHVSSTMLTTGIQIQNTSGSTATVNLDLYNWDGTSQSASNPSALTIPANGSGNFWCGSFTGLPTVPPALGGSGWFGSAVLTSDQPVVAVVSDEGYGATAVDSANYGALLIP